MFADKAITDVKAKTTYLKVQSNKGIKVAKAKSVKRLAGGITKA